MDKGVMSYRQAGVDIDAADRSVDMIKQLVGRTMRPEVIGGIGSFGGMFALDTAKYRQPVLVSGTDGVGTKLKIAQMLDRHDSVGIDLVAMCVNDILAQGAEPLFFLDYIALGKLVPEQVAALVAGVAEGCVQAGCALLGGETAEMPGFYGENEYDLAGFAVGVVERHRLIDGAKLKDGDVLLGLPSSGIHSNGYSLVRKVLLENEGLSLTEQPEGLKRPLGEELLTPTRIYVPLILELLQAVSISGMAHITGGGITENLQRILPPGLGAMIDESRIDVPAVFHLIEKRGRVPRAEMYRTFNMGVGFIVALPPAEAEKAASLLQSKAEKCMVLGKISKQVNKVVIT
ncbi:MAG: phosphoribosylformylglycinamidine cyclo-ligase [Syntrophomonadaceae bacterium]|nr:phosphoribosylformylglycinamidine cyclo-ligase [Syntrophomonadaceae bacterium]